MRWVILIGAVTLWFFVCKRRRAPIVLYYGGVIAIAFAGSWGTR